MPLKPLQDQEEDENITPQISVCTSTTAGAGESTESITSPITETNDSASVNTSNSHSKNDNDYDDERIVETPKRKRGRPKKSDTLRKLKTEDRIAGNITRPCSKRSCLNDPDIIHVSIECPGSTQGTKGNRDENARIKFIVEDNHASGSQITASESDTGDGKGDIEMNAKIDKKLRPTHDMNEELNDGTPKSQNECEENGISFTQEAEGEASSIPD